MTHETKGLPPLLPGVAAAVAFLLAGFMVLGVLSGEAALLLLALVPLFAGIGILRWRSWSAYGFALFEFAQLLMSPWILLRSSSGSSAVERLVVTVVFTVLLIVLFWAAGRSLARTAGPRGQAWPWILVSALCTVPWLFVEAFATPSGSMENTLLIGDRILVQTFPKPTPGRSDMVVFHYPVDRRQIFTKRVIGMPGDRIHLSAKTVYRNGVALSEPYVVHWFPLDAYRDNFPMGEAHFPLDPVAQKMLASDVVNGEVVVPRGKYFVLGDNRDNSLDSRYWGFLDGTDIIGRPLLIYGSQTPVASGTKAVDFGGLSRVRWGRLFKVL